VIGGQVALTPLPWPGGGWLAGALGGLELPLSARWLVAALLVAGFAAAWLRRRVVLIPPLPVIASLGVLCGLVWTSVPLSAYPMASLQFAMEWSTYALALGALVAALGRGLGPRLVLWSLTGASAIVASKGILEYAEMRATEPTYRIFADWNNPNALAGVLVLATPVATGLAMTARRVERLAAWSCAALASAALVLTQSKGGLASFLVAHAVLSVLALAWRARKAAAGAWAAPLAAIAFGSLLTGAQASPTGPNPGFSRLTQAAKTQDQSAGFRVLLWRSAASLALERPQGFGIGTFQYESPRPGLVPATYFAHQTWLQAAAETGLAGLLALVAFFTVSGRAALTGARSLPSRRRVLLASVAASLVGAVANGFVESNLYYFGTGVAVFALIGSALLLGSDGATPEMSPPPFRAGIVAAVSVFFFGGWSLLAYSEISRSQALARMSQGEGAAPPLLPWDADWWHMASLSARDPEQRLDAARCAAQWQPSPRMLRNLARILASHGRAGEAAATLRHALRRDPRNLRTLLQLSLLYEQEGDAAQAKAFAERAVAVEQTPVFRTRALPDLVPTETFDARLVLARHERDPAVRARLLSEACRGYLQFVAVTGPQIMRFERGGAPSGFLGLSSEDLVRARTKAKEAGMQAAELYRALGMDQERSKLLSELSALGSE
jgi:O-antigen ligase